MEHRIEELIHMHEVACSFNDEELTMTWLTLGVPDCPSIDDYEFIANDDTMYYEVSALFSRLMAQDMGYEIEDME